MARGSIELGANLTMIVIVGLIILGIALVFVLKFFHFAETETPKSYPEILFHATADDKLYPEGKELKISPGGSDTLLVSVYNAEWSSEEVIYLAFDECKDEDGNTATGFDLNSIGQPIERYKDAGYKVVIKVLKDVPQGNYVCSMLAGIPYEGNSINTDLPYYTRQVSITVI